NTRSPVRSPARAHPNADCDQPLTGEPSHLRPFLRTRSKELRCLPKPSIALFCAITRRPGSPFREARHRVHQQSNRPLTCLTAARLVTIRTLTCDDVDSQLCWGLSVDPCQLVPQHTTK